MRLAQMPIYRVGQDAPAARHHSRRDQRGQDCAMERWHSYSQNARVTLCSSAVGGLTGRPNSPTVSANSINDWFTWFGTRSSKSRLNVLDLLRAGHIDYGLNDAAYSYRRQHSLPASLIGRLM